MQNFNSVPPRSREERDASKNKEIIEKRMINVRGGYEARNIDARDLIHNANPTSNYYLPENERFDHNFSAYDKRIRTKEREDSEKVMEIKRIKNLEREQAKWEFMQKQNDTRDSNLAFKKQVLLMGKRNTNGLPYNPITLKYEKSKQGEQLKYMDEQAEVRGLLRSENLDQRSNCGYDVITGEHRQGVRIPQQYKQEFDNKKKMQEEYYSIKAPQNQQDFY